MDGWMIGEAQKMDACIHTYTLTNSNTKRDGHGDGVVWYDME